jgi:hypothetical protein
MSSDMDVDQTPNGRFVKPADHRLDCARRPF